MSVVKTLQKKISEFTSGLFATWMPDDRAAIGDYGQLREGRLSRHGNLSNKGIPVQPYVQSGSDPSFRYSDGVTFRASGSADVDGKVAGAGKVDMNFTKEGAFVYHSQGAEYRKIDNRDEVFAALIEKVATGEIVWEDTFVLVDEAFHCNHSTILISESKSGAVNVSADGSLDESENFANASGNLSFAVEHGSILNYAGNADSNPLYHAIRLRFPEPPDGGGGGGGLMQSIRERIEAWLGIAYPKPEQIDISLYKKGGNAFVVTVSETGAKMLVTIEPLKVDDLFSSDPAAAMEGDLQVLTVDVGEPAKKDDVKKREASG